MKYTILLFALFFGIASTATAQTVSPNAENTQSSNAQNIKLGPMFMPGMSTNAGSVANGTKTDAVDFSWALGALADFPFSPSLGLQLGLAYDSRNVGFHDQKTADTSISYTFSYFSLRPEFRMGDFLIGLGLGIPVGASASPSNAATSLNKLQSLGASSMNFLVEGRIGAAIPVMQSDNGSELRFLVEGSYAFSQINSFSLKPNDVFPNNPNKTENNGPLATLQLGFAYLFNLNSH